MTHPEISDRARDYLDLDSLFTQDELALRDTVRRFVDDRIRPSIAQWYADAHFPTELATELGALGLLGMQLSGYGCPGRSAVDCVQVSECVRASGYALTCLRPIVRLRR